MKKIISLLLFFSILKSLSAQQMPKGFGENGTMFRKPYPAPTGYILLDATKLSAGIAVHKVILKTSLFTQPQTDLTIEVYNVMFNQKDLAVFSVMPSLVSKDPVWQKINIDTLKAPVINLNQLHDLMKIRFSRYRENGDHDVYRLKYFDYVLILKRSDGYYCNATDCFTEFLTIADGNNESPTGFRLNLNAKMLSTAEYESAYYRANGGFFSSNYGNSETSLQPDGAPALNLSYIISDKGKKAYKFWLLDAWVQDGISYHRGMDRFVFEPGVGIIGAAYEFFMRDLSIYWYHAPEAPSVIIKGSAEDKKYYPITPYFPKSDPALFDYLTESVFNYVSIEKL